MTRVNREPLLNSAIQRKRKLILNKRLFTIGLIIGLAFFVGVNSYSYQMAELPCCHSFTSFGFPLRFGTYGGYLGYTRFDPLFLMANLLIGLLVSLGFAGLFAKVAPHVLGFFQNIVYWHVRTRL